MVRQRLLTDMLSTVSDPVGAGWKVLIMDAFTTRITSAALRMSDILDTGVVQLPYSKALLQHQQESIVLCASSRLQRGWQPTICQNYSSPTQCYSRHEAWIVPSMNGLPPLLWDSRDL